MDNASLPHRKETLEDKIYKTAKTQIFQSTLKVTKRKLNSNSREISTKQKPSSSLIKKNLFETAQKQNVPPMFTASDNQIISQQIGCQVEEMKNKIQSQAMKAFDQHILNCQNKSVKQPLLQPCVMHPYHQIQTIKYNKSVSKSILQKEGLLQMTHFPLHNQSNIRNHQLQFPLDQVYVEQQKKAFKIIQLQHQNQKQRWSQQKQGLMKEISKLQQEKQNLQNIIKEIKTKTNHSYGNIFERKPVMQTNMENRHKQQEYEPNQQQKTVHCQIQFQTFPLQTNKNMPSKLAFTKLQSPLESVEQRVLIKVDNLSSELQFFMNLALQNKQLLSDYVQALKNNENQLKVCKAQNQGFQQKIQQYKVQQFQAMALIQQENIKLLEQLTIYKNQYESLKKRHLLMEGELRKNQTTFQQRKICQQLKIENKLLTEKYSALFAAYKSLYEQFTNQSRQKDFLNELDSSQSCSDSSKGGDLTTKLQYSASNNFVRYDDSELFTINLDSQRWLKDKTKQSECKNSSQLFENQDKREEPDQNDQTSEWQQKDDRQGRINLQKLIQRSLQEKLPK